MKQHSMKNVDFRREADSSVSEKKKAPSTCSKPFFFSFSNRISCYAHWIMRLASL